MERGNLISVTLLVSALALNPLFAEHKIKTSTLLQKNRVTSKIASILHKRGLDEDAAKEISEKLLNEDEELFALMMNNLLHVCEDLHQDEILEYLSNAALHRQKVNLDSYSQLVSMITKIKESQLDEDILKQIRAVAQSNAMFVKNYHLYKEKVT